MMTCFGIIYSLYVILTTPIVEEQCHSYSFKVGMRDTRRSVSVDCGAHLEVR